MNIENMGFEEYFNLFCFVVTVNQKTFKYPDWQPREEDINRFNEALEMFKKQWEKDRGKVEKPFIFSKVKRDSKYVSRLNKAHEFEVFVENEFKKRGIDIGFFKTKAEQYAGETEIGLEIKYDQKLEETGNIYIEYEEKTTKTDKEFYKSGILKQDNTKWWLIGNKEEHYFIYKSDLLRYYKWTKDIVFVTEGGGTSKGFLLPREKAKEMCITQDFDEFIAKCLGEER